MPFAILMFPFSYIRQQLTKDCVNLTKNINMTMRRSITGRRSFRIMRRRRFHPSGSPVHSREGTSVPSEQQGFMQRISLPVPARTEPSPSRSSQPSQGIGWDHSASSPSLYREDASAPPLSALILGLFADPRVSSLTTEMVAQTLRQAYADVEITLETMAQEGVLATYGTNHVHYVVAPAYKAQLEAEFRASAQELGEHNLLASLDASSTDLVPFEDEEPRLPATAGLLSLFLPGTGQLLNGDIGRASLVFAVWSMAWITHLSPVWTFVCLYAGAEAFFTAKIRSMERKMLHERDDIKKLPSPRLT